jgi:hypothetical protein
MISPSAQNVEKVIRSARVPVVTVRSATREATPTLEEALAEDEVTR